MAKTVFLLRHGKSDWSQPGASDHERPLNQRGRAAAPSMGAWLKQQGKHVDLIVSSTATRARSTAQLVAEQLQLPSDQVQLSRRLYLAPKESYLDVLMEVSPNTHAVLLVGHNPGISELASFWAPHAIEMPTAAVVEVRLQLESWIDLDLTTASDLIEFKRPREL